MALFSLSPSYYTQAAISWKMSLSTRLECATHTQWITNDVQRRETHLTGRKDGGRLRTVWTVTSVRFFQVVLLRTKCCFALRGEVKWTETRLSEVDIQQVDNDKRERECEEERTDLWPETVPKLNQSFNLTLNIVYELIVESTREQEEGVKGRYWPFKACKTNCAISSAKHQVLNLWPKLCVL